MSPDSAVRANYRLASAGGEVQEPRGAVHCGSTSVCQLPGIGSGTRWDTELRVRSAPRPLSKCRAEVSAELGAGYNLGLHLRRPTVRKTLGKTAGIATTG